MVFFSLSVMHCKQHKLSRWALFALRANVVINIVYIKKKITIIVIELENLHKWIKCEQHEST